MRGQFLGIPMIWFGLLVLTIIGLIILWLFFTGFLDAAVDFLQKLFGGIFGGGLFGGGGAGGFW